MFVRRTGISYASQFEAKTTPLFFSLSLASSSLMGFAILVLSMNSFLACSSFSILSCWTYFSIIRSSCRLSNFMPCRSPSVYMPSMPCSMARTRLSSSICESSKDASSLMYWLFASPSILFRSFSLKRTKPNAARSFFSSDSNSQSALRRISISFRRVVCESCGSSSLILSEMPF